MFLQHGEGEEMVSGTISRACAARNPTALFLGTKRYLLPFLPRNDNAVASDGQGGAEVFGSKTNSPFLIAWR
jgi:hypothetical protein